MIGKAAHKLAMWASEKDISKSTSYEGYLYLSEIIVGSTITYSFLFVIALFFGIVPQMFTFVLFMSFLRSCAGGYHARSQLHCILLSVITSVFGVMLSILFSSYAAASILTVVAALSALYIWIHAPINHPDWGLSPNEADKCKTASRAILCIEFTIIALLFFFNIEGSIINSAKAGIIAVFLFMALSNTKGGKRNEKGNTEIE